MWYSMCENLTYCTSPATVFQTDLRSYVRLLKEQKVEAGNGSLGLATGTYKGQVEQ